MRRTGCCGLPRCFGDLAATRQVFGFVGGTHGLFDRQAVELTPELCQAYSGAGGLELLGRTVDRLKSDEELESARLACEDLGLTGLVLVGGARTGTDAAYLAEHCKRRGSKVAVVSVPCGVEGNMVNEFIEAGAWSVAIPCAAAMRLVVATPWVSAAPWLVGRFYGLQRSHRHCSDPIGVLATPWAAAVDLMVPATPERPWARARRRAKARQGAQRRAKAR